MRANCNTKVNQEDYVTLKGKGKGRVKGQGHSPGDLIKVYTHAKYHACNPKHEQEQTLTQRLTKVIM